MTDPVSRSQLEEALVWADEMAVDIMNGTAHSAEEGVKLFRQIEDAARAVLSAPTVRWCKVHLSPTMKEDGDEDGFDCQATHLLTGLQPCNLITVALVEVDND